MARVTITTERYGTLTGPAWVINEIASAEGDELYTSSDELRDDRPDDGDPTCVREPRPRNPITPKLLGGAAISPDVNYIA